VYLSSRSTTSTGYSPVLVFVSFCVCSAISGHFLSSPPLSLLLSACLTKGYDDPSRRVAVRFPWSLSRGTSSFLWILYLCPFPDSLRLSNSATPSPCATTTCKVLWWQVCITSPHASLRCYTNYSTVPRRLVPIVTLNDAVLGYSGRSIVAILPDRYCVLLP
jgi:hypothetical protein